mmetsp:Transcript_18775/g.37401  ORF Transcript_18775/g.37401 Transcript_18775/m.37401 type:complete len:223 (+) Transcript_18775:366-1034(+)
MGNICCCTRMWEKKCPRRRCRYCLRRTRARRRRRTCMGVSRCISPWKIGPRRGRCWRCWRRTRARCRNGWMRMRRVYRSSSPSTTRDRRRWCGRCSSTTCPCTRTGRPVTTRAAGLSVSRPSPTSPLRPCATSSLPRPTIHRAGASAATFRHSPKCEIQMAAPHANARRPDRAGPSTGTCSSVAGTSSTVARRSTARPRAWCSVRPTGRRRRSTAASSMRWT